jgi:hypothetical protein
MKWNQGCFDAVYHWMNNESMPCFAFIQCTVSMSHKYKLQFVSEFLQCLFPLPGGVLTRCGELSQSCEVHFWTIVDENCFTGYSLGDVEDVESVRNFDPRFGDFNESNPRILIGYCAASASDGYTRTGGY